MEPTLLALPRRWFAKEHIVFRWRRRWQAIRVDAVRSGRLGPTERGRLVGRLRGACRLRWPDGRTGVERTAHDQIVVLVRADGGIATVLLELLLDGHALAGQATDAGSVETGIDAIVVD